MKSGRTILLVASAALLASCGSSSDTSDTFSMPSFTSSSSSSSISSSTSTSSTSSYGSDIETLSEALDSFDRDNLGFVIESPTIQAKVEKNGIIDSKSLHTYAFDRQELLSKNIKDNDERETYFSIEGAQIYKQTLLGKSEVAGPKIATFLDKKLKAQSQSISCYINPDAAYYDLSGAPYFYDKTSGIPEKGYQETSSDADDILEAIGLLPIMVSASSDTISEQLSDIQNSEDSKIQISFENRDGDFYLNISMVEASDVKGILDDLVNAVFDALGKDYFTLDLGIEGIDTVKLEKQSILDWINESSNDVSVNSFSIGLGYGLYDIEYIDFNIDVDFSVAEDLKDALSLDYSLSKFVMDLRVNILGEDEIKIPALDLASYEKLS